MEEKGCRISEISLVRQLFLWYNEAKDGPSSAACCKWGKPNFNKR